jgi:hypothetical protein
MHERKLGDYCPSPSKTLEVTYSAELHMLGAATSLAGVTRDGERFGSTEALRLLEMMVCPPLYFTFDETGERASLHIQWHGMRFSRTSRIERMRQDLRQFAPELQEYFEQSFDLVKDCFATGAQPLTVEEVERAEQGL